MANAGERFPNLVPRVFLFKKAERRDPGNEVGDNHFHFFHVIYRMLDRWVSSHDLNGNSSVETLGKLFVPGGLRGWHCCASFDCVIHSWLETFQFGHN